MSGTFGDLLKGLGLESSGEEDAPEAPLTPEPAADGVTYAAKVVIRFSRKGHRGKTVTLIDGVMTGHKLLLKRLRKELAGGGRIDGETIVMQGEQVERIARWFESQGVTQVVRG